MRKELQDLHKQLKENHKEVFVLTVGDEPTDKQKDTRLYGFLRKPTFQEFRMIYPLIVKGDDLMADMKLLKACWLGGDAEIIDVDNNLDIFLSIKSELSILVDLKTATLKKK